MAKKYLTPIYEVVRIKKSNVIVTSVDQVNGNVFSGDITGSTEAARATGRGYYDWDAGY